jgi:molecular chaperone DnaK
MTDRVIGIDLGTTNSAVATIGTAGLPEIVADSAGCRTIPSAVYYAPAGGVIVGEDARQTLAVDPARVGVFFKRMMGNPEFFLSIEGRDFTAVDMSAQVLAHLAEVAAQAGVTHPKAVVTVPAYFKNVEREATIEAARQGGLDVICTVNEPTAAAIAYGINHPELVGKLVVYDLGGGTFDVTLLEYTAQELAVIATSGDHDLGGVLWDDALISIAVDHFAQETGVDVNGDALALGELRLAAEAAKRTLSAREQARIPVRCGGHSVTVMVTRAEFEDATAHLLDSTRSLLVRMLKDSGVRWPDIQAVLLVGGSTRMPAVRDLLATLSGRPPLCDINPDEAVALGAALRAAEETGALPVAASAGSSLPSVPAGPSGLIAHRTTLDVTSHSLGYVQESADGQRYINGIVIPRNSRAPAVQSRPAQVRTRAGRENTLEVLVFQGEAERVLDNEYAGAYLVSGIPHTTGTAVVDVSFGYDVSGVVVVAATDQMSGRLLPVEQQPRPVDFSWTDADPSAASHRGAPLPVMLVIDTSGSMCGTMDEAKQAAVGLIDQIDLDAMPTGLAEFGGSSGIRLDPTSDYSRLVSAIKKLSPSGGTPMGEALEACKRIFTDGVGVVVLLTDGEPNSPDGARMSADALRDLGVVVYTIGVLGADVAFLRSIASSPDASFEPSAGDLIGTFRSIGRDLAQGSGLGLRR